MTPPLRRSRLPFLSLATLSALAALLAPSAASAQQGVLANRFDPSEKGSDWFENESLDYRSNLRPAFGVIVDYSKDPIVLKNPDGSQSSLISDQLYLHVGASIALWERLRLGFELPLELAETGSTITTSTGTLSSPSGAAVGDLRLGADLRLYGEYEAPFRLAVGAQVYLPTGSTSHFTTEGEVRVMPRLMIAGDVDVFSYAVRIGYQVNPSNSYQGYELNDEVSMGASVGLRFLDKALLVGPEISSYTLAKNAFQSVDTPTELLLGAHYRVDDLMIGAGVGSSFNTGDALGSPSLRILAGIEYHPAVALPPPPPDRDKDGIPDEFDACPDSPGPYHEVAPKNGCPPDRDHDGVLDDVDACPDVEGPQTDDPKTNGCPRPKDRDGDGIPDAVDACPDVVGPASDDPKKNGCPIPVVDPDRDKDGILNEADACPDAAGPANADPKKNGCPLARVENGHIKISEEVKFAENSAVILKDSDVVLNAVVEILKAHPEVTWLRVEGYTDSKGSAVYNKNLSKQRAAAVKTWLVKHGIDGARLDSEGFGAEKPVDTNDTPEGRKNNRRVEFNIADKPVAPPPTAKPAPAKPTKK